MCEMCNIINKIGTDCVGFAEGVGELLTIDQRVSKSESFKLTYSAFQSGEIDHSEFEMLARKIRETVRHEMIMILLLDIPNPAASILNMMAEIQGAAEALSRGVVSTEVPRNVPRNFN